MDKLKKLVKKWRRRREKLRKRCVDFSKNNTEANKRWENIEFGKFQEIEKCASELVASIRSQLTDTSCPKFTIGDYGFYQSTTNDECFYVMHKSGEGSDFPKADIAEVIKKYYNNHF